MTALKKYQKLECAGLWRAAPGEQRREVLVNFGEASLTMADPGSELALSHWSLPAVARLNPGEHPALYAPGPEADETLEIEDRDMIAALDTVQAALRATLPRPGRLRSSLLVGTGALFLLLAVVWGPGVLVRHTAAMVPPATRAEIGALALADLRKLTGKPCAARHGTRAAERLARRVFGADPVQILVLPDGVRQPAHLPDGRILFGRTMVETADGPEVLAGFALAEGLRARAEDPMVPLLHHAGTVATFQLLATGELPPSAVEGYGESLLLSPPQPLAVQPLAAAFAAADLPSRPYAQAVDPAGETLRPLVEADTRRGATVKPVLADEDWVSLQDICRD